MKRCQTCGHSTISCTCGLTWRQRVLGTQVDVRVLETRTRRNYADMESIRTAFGEDAEQQYWDDTNGMGAMHRQPDGTFVHTDFRGETRQASAADFDTFFGDEETADVV